MKDLEEIYADSCPDVHPFTLETDLDFTEQERSRERSESSDGLLFRVVADPDHSSLV